MDAESPPQPHLDHVGSADFSVCVGTSSGTLELDHLDVVQIGE